MTNPSKQSATQDVLGTKLLDSVREMKTRNPARKTKVNLDKALKTNNQNLKFPI